MERQGSGITGQLGAFAVASTGKCHATPTGYNHELIHDQKVLQRIFFEMSSHPPCTSCSLASHDIVVLSNNEVQRCVELAVRLETANSLGRNVTVSFYYSTGTDIHTYYAQLSRFLFQEFQVECELDVR